MDLASGASPARLALVEAEARTSLLGDTLNFPMPHILCLRPQVRPSSVAEMKTE